MHWIKTEKQMPEPGKPVLAAVGKRRVEPLILRVCWIPQYFHVDDGDYDGDADYNEQEDKYYWPEGWYEWNQYDETHWKVGETVFQWMPLPAFPE